MGTEGEEIGRDGKGLEGIDSERDGWRGDGRE